MNTIRKCFTVCMLVSALLCFALPCMSASPVEIPQGYKVVRTEKLDALKANNDKLVLKLAELEMKLELLKMPSTELVEQLAVARNELQLCKQELKSAKLSLENAKRLQDRTLVSLEVLEQKLEQERKVAKRKARINKIYGIAWGLFIGALVGVTIQ